ncbi:Zn-ribbon domain-containing OB-fold protein [Mycolicibacterium confluentis]|uniref:DNA-binding protein n=1 Tax=Mycolicibacterium confluentis TaxID=28047 RepID=A0A7I7Y0F8_9MYCO|nr:OB-fold domain-containing protein [Mycolicibacterium confluentis]MCV7320032.1 OB-fold domain-containing protein [Mycolicibacterium confluentis]ORV34581.1 DNA-binding protein [Mycolicibacterium confluentis]BBZ35067.1 DNA-binding protein [Mycolicibacterium confluentis]
MTAASVDPGILEFVDGAPRLIGGRCGACGEVDFPVPQYCRACGAEDITATRLGDRGTLWSWTVQRFPPPSPPYVPAGEDFEAYGVGYVELPGEVIVEARLTESDPGRLRIGMPMQLTALDVPTETGTRAVTFAFTPEEP